ncbi:MAG: hypothetical protein IPN90_03770 [Elusimicrobia bacterium]|nr:hypothetical protein [Elusimicrobiota bacterium]
MAGGVRRCAGNRLEYLRADVAAQRFPLVFHELSPTTVMLLEPNGRLYFGAQAVYKTRALIGSPFLWTLYQTHPWFALLSEWGYRLVTVFRPFLSTVLDLLLGPPPDDL